MKKRRKILWILALLLLLALGWWLVIGRWPVVSMDRLEKATPLYQYDFDEVVTVVGGQDKSVHTSGCGAVCIAMAANYLTGQYVSPETLFRWACENDYYQGDGLSHEALSAMAASLGLDGQWIANEREPVLAALKAGCPVVAHMGKGTFTKGGHYILLRGVAPDGTIYVNDPQSARHTEAETFSIDLILKEIRREDSFMVVKRRLI